MTDYAPRWRRALSGAPILRGRWAAIIFLFAAGVCFDKIETIDRLTSGTGGYAVWWPTDTPWLLAAITFSAFGTLALDMYGRVCWLTHAPDGVTWNGLTREDCNRVPLIRRPRWLMWRG
jgi:hypothetical protein